MDPATIGLIIGALLKYGPDAAEAIRNLFKKSNPTLEDFDPIFALARKPYEYYVRPDVNALLSEFLRTPPAPTAHAHAPVAPPLTTNVVEVPVDLPVTLVEK